MSENPLKEALLECREYFDLRADADQPSGAQPIPNEEMRLLVMIDEALRPPKTNAGFRDTK